MSKYIDRLIKCLMVCRIKIHAHCKKTLCCSECDSDCVKDNQTNLTPINSTHKLSIV